VNGGVSQALQATVEDHESRLDAIEALLGPGGENLTAIHRRIDSLVKVVDKIKDDDDDEPPPMATSALISALNEQRAALNAIATLLGPSAQTRARVVPVLVPAAALRGQTRTPLQLLPFAPFTFGPPAAVDPKPPLRSGTTTAA
jgi:hypothetical protein